MFSSNNTPADEFVYARELGATINLDAYEDIAFLKSVTSIPKVISCRYNPGGVFELGNRYYGQSWRSQVWNDQGSNWSKPLSSWKELGVEEFGIHAFISF